MLKQRKERHGEESNLQMTPRQMLLRIIEIVSADRISPATLERILKAVEAKAASGRLFVTGLSRRLS
jgi:hypothetical protein